MTYQVTITVEDVPRLGSCTFTVEAASASEAEEKALAAMREKWAVGGTFVAQADEETRNDLPGQSRRGALSRRYVLPWPVSVYGLVADEATKWEQDPSKRFPEDLPR